MYPDKSNPHFSFPSFNNVRKTLCIPANLPFKILPSFFQTIRINTRSAKRKVFYNKSLDKKHLLYITCVKCVFFEMKYDFCLPLIMFASFVAAALNRNNDQESGRHAFGFSQGSGIFHFSLFFFSWNVSFKNTHSIP